MELIRRPVEGLLVPSEGTIVRILARQGLAVGRRRKRPRESYRRWERPAPMQLWGIDIVGGPTAQVGTGRDWRPAPWPATN